MSHILSSALNKCLTFWALFLINVFTFWALLLKNVSLSELCSKQLITFSGLRFQFLTFWTLFAIIYHFLSSGLTFCPLGRFLHWDVLSLGTFCPLGRYVPETLCPWDDLFLGTFCPWDVWSWDVLYASSYFLSSALISMSWTQLCINS